MNLFFLLLAALILWKSEFTLRSFHNCLSVQTTGAVKAIAAVAVVFHHLSQLLEHTSLFSAVFIKMGIFAVSLFFFYSGYGLMKSYRTKQHYADTFFVRRILSIAVPYLGFTALYWAVTAVLQRPYSLGEVLLSFVNGSPLVYDSWYILTILVFYVFFYFLMRLFREKHMLIFLGSLLWLVLWVILCKARGLGFHWYNSAIALCCGIFFGTAEETVLPLIKRYYWLWLLLLLPATPVVMVLSGRLGSEGIPALVLRWASCLGFVGIVLLATSKIRLGNPILSFLNRISFELYLTHRIFIWLLRGKFLYIQNDFLWCGCVLVLSVAAAWGLHKLFGRLNSAVQKKFLTEVNP